MYLKAYIKNGPVVSEKSKFQKSYVNNQTNVKMTLTLNSQVMNSISCMHLPTVRSQAATVSEKNSLLKLLPIEKP